MPKGVWGRNHIEYEFLPLMQEFVDEHPKYRSSLGHFSNYLRSIDVTDPRKIDKKTAQGFVDYVFTLSVSDTTRQMYMYHARAWMGWLKDMGIIIVNPWGDKDYPLFGKINIHIPKTKALSPRELGLVFEVHRQRRNKISPFWWHREAVILACIYGWSLGPTEIANMTASQVHPKLDYITVKSARSHIRRMKDIPYGDEMKTIMRRWLNVRLPREKPGIDNLIIDITGEPIQPESIMKHMNKLGKEAGVRLTSSRLKETGLQAFLSSSVSLEEITAMLGISRETALLHIKDDNSPYSAESKELIDGMLTKLRVRQIRYGNEYWRQSDAKQDEEAEGI